MICPNCNTQVPHGKFECPNCKSDLLARYQEIKQYPMQCPHCGKMTDSLKVYRLPSVWVFLGPFLRWATEGHIACPSCMRKKILLHGMTYNIVTANFIWPVTILPWSIVNLLRTFSKGHSTEIVDYIDNQINQ